MKSGRTWLNPISLASSLLQLLALLPPFMRFTASPSPPSSPSRHQPESQSEFWARFLLPASSSSRRGMLWDHGSPEGKGGGTNSTLSSKCLCNHRNISHRINITEKPEFLLAKAFHRYPNLPAAGWTGHFSFEKNDISWPLALLFRVFQAGSINSFRE